MRISLVCIVVLALATFAFAQTPSAPPFDAAFDAYWGDQKAELAGYDLKFPRYGQIRTGSAVAIFVTEPFSNEARVKADAGRHSSADEFPVFKLNLVEDFPTGLYDYNLMTSVFVAMKAVNNRPPGTPAKISFSSQEWCGHVYHQVLLDDGAARDELHSYFDGEADQQNKLDLPNNAATEDALPLWARGLAGPYLKPGESVQLPMLRSLKIARLVHRPVVVQAATLERNEKPERVTVPAGEFEAEVRVAKTPDGTWTFWVEREHPHRLIQWTHSSGIEAKLVASDRLTYWQMHDEGMEKSLGKIGFKPRPARTP